MQQYVLSIFLKGGSEPLRFSCFYKPEGILANCECERRNRQLDRLLSIFRDGVNYASEFNTPIEIKESDTQSFWILPSEIAYVTLKEMKTCTLDDIDRLVY